MRLLEYTVGEQQAGRTVKSIALRELRLSHSQFSSLKYRQGILADGQPVHADVRLRPGQVLTVRLEEEAGEEPICPSLGMPENSLST